MHAKLAAAVHFDNNGALVGGAIVSARPNQRAQMDLHELKLSLQRHFTDGLVTVVGSGLSCAEGLPGMSELASHLQTVIGDGLEAADKAHWAALAPLIATKGLETALLELAPTPALESKIVAQTAELIAHWPAPLKRAQG